LDDNALIEKILTSDKNLYAEIMEKYHNEIFKYIYNMVNNYNDTEDLVQEIFFKIYKNLKKYNPNKASFRTWMYRISKNHVINYLKSSKSKINRNNLEYDDSINKSDENVEESVIKDNQINMILKAMEKILSPKNYEIMHLHYFSNLTVKEISQTLSIPDKTIYKAIKSSINKLKKEVDVSDEI